MKPFLTALFLALLLSASPAGAEIGTIDNQAMTRTVKGNDGATYVEFYSMCRGIYCSYFMPATFNAKPHYDATVKLYRKDGENLIYVAERYGQWIDDGCFEMDVPVPYETRKR